MILSGPFVIGALLIGAYVLLVLPLTRSRVRRGLAAALLIVVYAGLLGVGLHILGRAKPIDGPFALVPFQARDIIAAVPVEGEGIWVWVQEDEPRAYRLQWSLQTAVQLRGAMAEASAKGTVVRMEMMPVEDGGIDDREPKFYAMPQPALPPKQYQ